VEVRQHLPLVVPVRGKKRHFIPPAVGAKGRVPVDPERAARARGFVLQQQYMERSINISCTGNTTQTLITPPPLTETLKFTQISFKFSHCEEMMQRLQQEEENNDQKNDWVVTCLCLSVCLSVCLSLCLCLSGYI